jgi:hypothetical protein
MRHTKAINVVDSLLPRIRETGDPKGVLMKYANDNNLSLDQLQKLANVFNTAKTLTYLDRSENRGGSFPLLEVEPMLDEYSRHDFSVISPSSLRKAANAQVGYDPYDLSTALQDTTEMDKAASDMGEALETMRRYTPDEMTKVADTLEEAMWVGRDRYQEQGRSLAAHLNRDGCGEFRWDSFCKDAAYLVGADHADAVLKVAHVFCAHLGDLPSLDFEKVAKARQYDASLIDDQTRLQAVNMATELYKVAQDTQLLTKAAAGLDLDPRDVAQAAKYLGVPVDPDEASAYMEYDPDEGPNEDFSNAGPKSTVLEDGTIIDPPDDDQDPRDILDALGFGGGSSKPKPKPGQSGTSSGGTPKPKPRQSGKSKGSPKPKSGQGGTSSGGTPKPKPRQSGKSKGSPKPKSGQGGKSEKTKVRVVASDDADLDLSWLPKPRDVLEGAKQTNPIPSAVNVQSKVEEFLGKHAPKTKNLQKEVDEGANEVRRLATLRRLMMSDPIISEADPEKVLEFYSTMMEANPRLTQDPRLTTILLREALQYDTVPLHTLSEMTKLRGDTAKAERDEAALSDLKYNNR